MTQIAIDLQAGISAARAGDHEQARGCLLRVLKQEPRNETAWLWLSRVMPSIEQALRCVDHLLTINPHHQQAREAKDVLHIRMLLEEAAVIQTPSAPTSTPQRRYKLGEALVEARVITPEQLEVALHEQVKFAGKQQPLRLGEILLRLKLVRPEQLEAAIAVQIETQPGSEQSGATGQLGEYLMRQGLLTRPQLHQGLARQNELKRQGVTTLLGDILADCGYIQRDQLNRAMVEWQDQYNLAFR